MNIKIDSQHIEIEDAIFTTLLDLSPVKERAAYRHAISSGEISFGKLKELAEIADVPYPLFFAPKSKVVLQLKDKDKNLFEKLPTKPEAQVGLRGKMNPSDLELIVKDLARKQEFLKKRILPAEPDNSFIGELAKMVKAGKTPIEVANKVRDYFNIDVAEMRALPRAKVIAYLTKKIEAKNILLSISSYNFMPQNIARNVAVSGICVKDKKFPFIFINTRDGDEKPMILESEGRQIFSVISMLVCIGMNKFVLNMKSKVLKDASLKYIFSITAEILIPKNDLKGVVVKNLDDLKDHARFFKVTPSMLLIRLREFGLITKATADSYSEKLLKEIEKAKTSPKKQASLITGYSKYNGQRFSHEVVKAHRAGGVSHDEVKNILFRKGKMDTQIFQQYCTVYK